MTTRQFAPKDLVNRYWTHVRALGATSCVEGVPAPRLGGAITFYVSQRLSDAARLYGVPHAGVHGTEARWQSRIAPYSEEAMKTALTLRELYGDDAVDVWWNVGLLHPDETVRESVFKVLEANGCDVRPGPMRDFLEHAFDALLLAEAALNEGEPCRLANAA